MSCTDPAARENEREQLRSRDIEISRRETQIETSETEMSRKVRLQKSKCKYKLTPFINIID